MAADENWEARWFENEGNMLEACELKKGTYLF